MNTTIFVFIVAIALFEDATISESARQSVTRVRSDPGDEIVDEQIVEIDGPSSGKLSSFSSSSSFNDKKIGRTSSKLSRTTSKSKPSRTGTFNLTANVPDLKVGQSVTIDNKGTVTKDDNTIVYKQHPNLKGNPKQIKIRNGKLYVNGIPILKTVSKNKVSSSFSTPSSPNAKWTKIEISTKGVLKITDDRDNTQFQFI